MLVRKYAHFELCGHFVVSHISVFSDIPTLRPFRAFRTFLAFRRVGHLGHVGHYSVSIFSDISVFDTISWYLV